MNMGEERGREREGGAQRQKKLGNRANNLMGATTEKYLLKKNCQSFKVYHHFGSLGKYMATIKTIKLARV